MRILFWIFMLIGLTTFNNLVEASPGMELKKVALDLQWTEGEAPDSTMHLTSKGDWDWLRLGLTNKFYLTPVEDKYSSFDSSMVFPEFTADLCYSLGYSWNDKYKIYDTGIDYSCKPLQKLRLDCGYKIEERKPEKTSGSPYQLNTEIIGFVYRSIPWEYSFKLLRNDKEYPEDPQYTSLKIKLNQGLGWRPLPGFQLELAYQEETGDYFSKNLNDYWKEEWTLKGEHNKFAKWQYGLEYSKLNWERGFDPYRADQQLKLKMQSKGNSITKVLIGVVYADRDYYSA
jgi:hypothetical protein